MSVTQTNEWIKPSIIIRVMPHSGHEFKLREIQAGIEEEGVPCSWTVDTEPNPAVLAYAGAGDSQLGVGVGVSEIGLCIQHHKLPACEPLFRCENDGTPQEWRLFGSNAARLAKGLPFKKPALDPPAELTKDELIKMVQALVYKVLQENTVTGR